MLNLCFECAYHGTITRFSTFFNCLRGTLILKRSAPEVLLQLTLMQLTSHRPSKPTEQRDSVIQRKSVK